MDLGATVCVARNPKCGICPVQGFCRATHPSILPLKKARPREKRLSEFHSFSRAHGRILLEQSRKRWRGLWILPTVKSKPVGQSALHVSKFPFTHHRVTLAVFAAASCAEPTTDSQRWFRIRDLSALPIPSPHRRALNCLVARNDKSFAAIFPKA
jgi:A/G-specific adenine glycosylase